MTGNEALYELLLELATEENQALNDEVHTLKAYIEYLEHKNKDLIAKHNASFDLNKRQN